MECEHIAKSDDVTHSSEFVCVYYSILYAASLWDVHAHFRGLVLYTVFSIVSEKTSINRPDQRGTCSYFRDP